MIYIQKMQKRLDFGIASEMKKICYLLFRVWEYVFDGKQFIGVDWRTKYDLHETSTDIWTVFQRNKNYQCRRSRYFEEISVWKMEFSPPIQAIWVNINWWVNPLLGQSAGYRNHFAFTIFERDMSILSIVSLYISIYSNIC